MNTKAHRESLDETDSPSSVLDQESLPLRIASILVPTDFSDESKNAVRYATRFAEQFGASIHLVYVIESMENARNTGLLSDQIDVAGATKVLQSKLAELANDEIEELVPVYPHVAVGRAFEEIVSLARTSSADLIIIATHGRTGMKHVLMGSVAERVVRHAACPVLVVRSNERDFA